MSGKSRAASRQRNTINRGRRRFIEGIAAAGAVAAFRKFKSIRHRTEYSFFYENVELPTNCISDR
jgi:hypothetical protein